MFNYKSIILKKKILLLTFLLATFFYIIFLSININLYKTTILVKNFSKSDFNKYNSLLLANSCYTIDQNTNSIIAQTNTHCYNLDFQRLLSSEINFNDFVNIFSFKWIKHNNIINKIHKKKHLGTLRSHWPSCSDV